MFGNTTTTITNHPGPDSFIYQEITLSEQGALCYIWMWAEAQGNRTNTGDKPVAFKKFF